MEGADEVLARRHVDRGLAADRAVDLGEQGGGDLDEAAAALEDRRGEADQIAEAQAEFINFYPEDGVNPYVALAARGPWVVTLKGAIVYDAGSVVYVNRPRGGAEQMDDWDIMVNRLYSSELCSIDTVQLIDQGSRMYSGTVFLGEFVRGMHKWGSTMMVILIFLHMGRVFFFGAYKYPREMNWIIGFVLLILTFVMSLTGYLLPFDQRSYWATIVAANITASGPIVGPYLGDFLRGGAEFGATTLSRFYSIHMLLIPGLIVVLIGFTVTQYAFRTMEPLYGVQPGEQQLPQPLEDFRRPGDQVREPKRRHHQQRLKHLGQEAEPEQHARQHQPAGPVPLDRALHAVRRRGHQQHEQRVRVVEPEDQRGRRRERELLVPRRRLESADKPGQSVDVE